MLLIGADKKCLMRAIMLISWCSGFFFKSSMLYSHRFLHACLGKSQKNKGMHRVVGSC